MGKKQSAREPRLPVQQLVILAICRVSEPIVMTSVYPYLPEMIESFGVHKSEVAKYAGLISAIFSIAQCATAVFWGRLSDSIGRKPSILFGLIVTMTTSVMFGMAQSFGFAITVRAVAGACNGNVGIIRTMVAEMVPEKVLQPRAFSIMPLVWTIGSILGPSFGGFFTKPVERMPALFGNSKYLAKYPFALPNLIAAVLFLIGISVGTLFLKETLETRRNSPDYGRMVGNKLVRLFNPKSAKHYRHHERYNDEAQNSLLRSASSSSEDSQWPGNNQNTPKVTKASPRMSEVFSRQSAINLSVYTFLALHSVSFDQLLPIFMHLPKQIPDESNTSLPFKFSGGFGLKSDRIGTLFTMYGIVGCIIQFAIFPPVARRYGVLNCLKSCALVFPIVYIATPFTALIQDPTTQQATMFAIMLVKCVAVIFAFPCSTILLTNSALNLRVLGTLNGFATSFSAIGRGSGPALGGLTFTWGAEHGYIITPWWILASITILGTIPIWYLVEMEGFGGSNGDDESDEAELPLADEEDGLFVASDEPLAPNEAGEALDNPISKVHSRSTPKSTPYGSLNTKSMSSPIGIKGGSVGPGGARRLSNGLGQTNNGTGAGGSNFTG